jgi:hypothetical protein
LRVTAGALPILRRIQIAAFGSALKRGENDLNKMLKRALPLTILPYRGDRLLVERVRQLLRQHSADFPTAETLAFNPAIIVVRRLATGNIDPDSFPQGRRRAWRSRAH